MQFSIYFVMNFKVFNRHSLIKRSQLLLHKLSLISSKHVSNELWHNIFSRSSWVEVFSIDILCFWVVFQLDLPQIHQAFQFNACLKFECITINIGGIFQQFHLFELELSFKCGISCMPTARAVSKCSHIKTVPLYSFYHW